MNIWPTGLKVKVSDVEVGIDPSTIGFLFNKESVERKKESNGIKRKEETKEMRDRIKKA